MKYYFIVLSFAMQMICLRADEKIPAINHPVASFQSEKSQGEITRLFIGRMTIRINPFQVDDSRSFKDNFQAQAYCQSSSNGDNIIPIEEFIFLEPFLQRLWTAYSFTVLGFNLEKNIRDFFHIKEFYAGETNIPDLHLLSRCRLNKLYLARTTVTNLDFLENQDLDCLQLLGVKFNPRIYDKDYREPMFRTGNITKPDYTATLPESCNIKSLKLADIDFLDINSLKNKHLAELSVNSCNFTAIEPIVDLPIRKLEITRCPIESLENIDKMPLIELKLAKISRMKSLKDMENLKLQKLTLDECRLLDYSALKTLDKLQSLSIAFPPSRIVKKNNFTMELLSKMPLQELSLKRSSPDEMEFDLAVLSGKQIKHLELEASSLINYHVLSSLPLESLYLKINTVDDELLEVISKMKNLRILSIVGGKLNNEKLEKIAHLFLTSLDISSHSKVTSLSSLKNMPLQYLRLYRTGVTDLEPLQKMPLAGIDIRYLKLNEASKEFIDIIRSQGVIVIDKTHAQYRNQGMFRRGSRTTPVRKNSSPNTQSSVK